MIPIWSEMLLRVLLLFWSMGFFKLVSNSNFLKDAIMDVDQT